MRVFKASQELIDILLKFGFKDETERYYPKHFSRLKGNVYDPYQVKRRFSTGSYKDYILLDYINIKVSGDEEKYEITEDELKSLIVFHNLSAKDRRSWRLSNYGKLEAKKITGVINKYPAIYPTALQKRIRDSFNRLGDRLFCG